jgi:hypothetical protein
MQFRMTGRARKAVSFVALVFCAGAAFAQPPNDKTGAIAVWSGVLAYPYRADSLKSVDFKNLRYSFGNDSFILHNGRYDHKYKPFGGIDSQLEDVWFFDEKDGVSRHALVSIYVMTYGGSSSPNGYVVLFEIQNGRLVETQEFSYNAQAPGTGASFDAAIGKLTITGRSDDDTPNCCPKNVDVASFQGRDGRFEPVGYKVEWVDGR